MFEYYASGVTEVGAEQFTEIKAAQVILLRASNSRLGLLLGLPCRAALFGSG
jgi:hypothetical protein